MQKAKRIVIIAGEESGDIHACALVQQLKTTYPNIEITGIGGQHMKSAGVELIYDLARFGVTGFTEVIRYLHILRQAFLAIKKHLKEQKPDLLILVDYPGFNLKLAQYAKKRLGLKILYYISPQIWAWKAKRIHLIKECVDKIAVILPFEKKLYEEAGVPVNYVGHPLTEKIPSFIDLLRTKKDLGLPLEKTLIALLPGSRKHEINKHMPILQKTIQLLSKQHPEFHFVIPIASTINPQDILSYFPLINAPVSQIQGNALACMAVADFVIVASGTASLECALLKKPMCIIYKSSFLTYLAATYLMKVKFLGLCNILVNKMIVPEFLQYDCNAIALSHYVLNFYRQPNPGVRMREQLLELQHLLSMKNSDCSLIDIVNEMIL